MKLLRLTAVGATLALATLAGVGSANADAPTAYDLLQAGAQQGVTDGYPGVIGLVRHGDSTQYVHAGVGDRSTGAPADPTAQFRIGSNTKAFTATVLLQLEGEHRLSLDDTVAKWLPGAVDANGYDGSTITLRELLNQTSGLPDYIDDLGLQLADYTNADPSRLYPPQTLVDAALALHKPTSAPGQKWGYSNTNYVLAGMVIEAVTGNDPATEIQHRIIEPLGLTHTTFPTTDPTLHGTYLHGYEWFAGLALRDVTTSNVQISGAAGAIVSTLDDLATFDRALLTGTLLPPAQEAELKTTVPTDSTGTAGYGLGIYHQQLPCGQWAWDHDGDVLGYHSIWLASDDGSKQVVLAANEFHMMGPTNGQNDTGGAALNALCA
ncbi:serine hydrolase domain-containing protein [Actinacidiphila sp. bgisy145]|uniref:serine hydrolase domain-containing protein n=1 Tax=Actinacidiphila sp. bgisy145 TaxID=3413792 RepID=UPI003EBF50C7